ncbi:hypothetical protein O181_020245 [Austropuccinia psidii MF-1]|uniref:Uncharacterized protein n=1 Tax=Austropuccinia psidii MF-1 TaxID=1389203 RepID=A0A9Q3CC76_9BASI|nr:hypothetical protein [Austropuccinia psidii MF-1]
MPHNWSFIAYLTLSLLCALINVAPTVSHLAQGHSGPASFGVWVVVLNILAFVNGVIWRNDALDRAPIFCDISAKLSMVGPLGLLISNCCIIRYLAQIVTPHAKVGDHWNSKARICIDYGLAFGVPAVVALASVIFQVARYQIETMTGCTNVSLLAWPTLFIFLIWSPILCGIACGYALYVLYWLIRQHHNLRQLAAKSRTPLSVSRFIRMCALAATYLCISAPYTVAGTMTIVYDIGPFVPWKSWKYIHNSDNQLWEVRSNPLYSLNLRDWVPIVAGLTIFCFFSFANESITIYTKITQGLYLPRFRTDIFHRKEAKYPGPTLRQSWKNTPFLRRDFINSQTEATAIAITNGYCEGQLKKSPPSVDLGGTICVSVVRHSSSIEIS